MDARDEEYHRYFQTERQLRISVVYVPKAYPEGIASKNLSVPVQCFVDGTTCWCRLVAMSLGERRCEACRFQVPYPYYAFLQVVYAYGLFFSDGVDMDAEEQLPHVFCMLSPRCEAENFELKQCENMIATDARI